PRRRERVPAVVYHSDREDAAHRQRPGGVESINRAVISLVRAIIRELTVTHGDARDALRIDPVLLRAADIRAFEEVEIVNLATGARSRAWAEPAAEASGEVHAPGA